MAESYYKNLDWFKLFLVCLFNKKEATSAYKILPKRAVNKTALEISKLTPFFTTSDVFPSVQTSLSMKDIFAFACEYCNAVLYDKATNSILLRRLAKFQVGLLGLSDSQILINLYKCARQSIMKPPAGIAKCKLTTNFL